MLKSPFTFLLVCLWTYLSSTAFGQQVWHLELSGGRTVNLDHDGGWNVGLGVGHDLPGGVQLYAHGAYHSLTAAATFIPFVIYEQLRQRDLTHPTVPGAITSDQNISLYEGSLELRIISPGTIVAPFLSIESGVYVLHFGDAPFAGAMPTPGWYVGYRLADETMVKGFAALGMGAEVLMGDRVALGVRADYARTFDGDFVFLPIVSTIGFRF